MGQNQGDRNKKSVSVRHVLNVLTHKLHFIMQVHLPSRYLDEGQVPRSQVKVIGDHE